MKRSEEVNIKFKTRVEAHEFMKRHPEHFDKMKYDNIRVKYIASDKSYRIVRETW